jgi:two-component sensor histidine kinase
MTNESDFSWDSAKIELLKRVEKSHVMLVYVCSCIFFAWTGFDYFLFPNQYTKFLIGRMVFALIPILVCYFRKQIGIKVIYCLFITALSISIYDAYIINIIPEKEFKTFALAQIIFFIGVGMLALWEILYSYLLFSVSLVLNIVFYFYLSPIKLSTYLVDGQIAVLSVAIFSILLVNIRYKLVLKEIRSRMELEISNQTIQIQRDEITAYANQMEVTVSERTAELKEKSLKIIEQKNFYDSIFFNIPIEISIFNERHEYLFANKMAIKEDALRNKILGKNDLEYCSLIGLDVKKTEKRLHYFQLSLESRKPTDFEESFASEIGNEIWKQFGFYPIYEGEKLLFMIFYSSEITAKKRYEIDIEKSLKEKEALLGEVHHRVKNNLALITGLIEFQKIKINDELVRKEFDEIKHRITSMALIHETLYKSANFASVDLSDCLDELASGLKNFYGKSKDIKLSLNLESTLVSTKMAIPVALMVNEMVTNCFKHAFTHTETGEIKIRLTKKENQLEFIISDNGNGINQNTDPLKNNSLGMRLISIFVKQIKGQIDFTSSYGLTIKVVAPIS